MTVESFLEYSAYKYPNKTAIVYSGNRYTYQQIETNSNQLANALVSFGVKRGDRIAIYLDNSIESVLAIFATLKAGAVFIVINPSTKINKLSYLLDNSRAKVFLTQFNKLSSINNCLETNKDLDILIVMDTNLPTKFKSKLNTVSLNTIINQYSNNIHPPIKNSIDIDLAALIYTSGSTGIPKGVMMTHLNIISASTSITHYLQMTENDIVLNVLPLSFDYGLYQLLMSFKVGCTLVLERSFTYIQDILNILINERVTGFPIVPTISAILLKRDLSKYDFSALRYISCTSAYFPINHIKVFRKLFPWISIFSMYGLTECKRVSYLSPDLIDEHPDSVGKAIPNQEVYIVDEFGNKVSTNTIGELVVRGSNVMLGYWDLPDETEKVLKPGILPGEKVLYTGDLFRMDSDGFLYFEGRKDNIIKSRGEKVSPLEVESVLYQLDGISETVVFAVPDEILGEAIKAVVTLKPDSDISKDDVFRHCKNHLENYMVPTIVEIRNDMPRTSSGKLTRLPYKGILTNKLPFKSNISASQKHL